jgi:hypothetical protein
MTTMTTTNITTICHLKIGVEPTPKILSIINARVCIANSSQCTT